MALSVIVATKGRESLRGALDSARRCLPVGEFLLLPSRDAVLSDVEADIDVNILPVVDGVYSAWNSGLAAATGSHVMFLNDDDHIEGPDFSGQPPEHDEIWNMPLRLENRGIPPSTSLLTRVRRLRAADLFYANRAGNINTYIWPVSLFRRFGGFDSSYRVRGDTDWMQRLIGEPLSIVWREEPTYVQSRGPTRLSSWERDKQLLVDEARQVEAAIRRVHGRAAVTTVMGKVWVAALDRRSRR